MKRGILAFLAIVTVLPLGAQSKDALVLYRQGDYAQAVDVTQAEIKNNPNNMDSYTVLGWSLIRLKRYQEAADFSTQALKISSYDYRVMENLGESLYYLGRNQEALKYFEQYTVLQPEGERIDQVYYLMGEIFLQLGEYNHADVAFSTAVHYSPSQASWWARLGYARQLAKDYRFANAAYDEALRLNPNLAEAQRGKSQVAGLTGQ